MRWSRGLRRLSIVVSAAALSWFLLIVAIAAKVDHMTGDQTVFMFLSVIGPIAITASTCGGLVWAWLGLKPRTRRGGAVYAVKTADSDRFAVPAVRTAAEPMRKVRVGIVARPAPMAPRAQHA